MLGFRRRFQVWSTLAGLSTAALVAPANAQNLSDEEFVTGPAAALYEKWRAAMEAVGNRAERDAADKAIGELLAMNPSPFRVALMAERSVRQNEAAGGAMMFEQDGAAGSLKDNGKKLYELLDAGKEQMNEADDGWYFASVGQFGIANANFKALIDSKPDTVALLEFADRVQRRHQVLVTLAGDPIMGESVKGVMRLLQEGELRIKSDPTRIKQNIERLGGPPRQYENSVARLKESGQFAIPFLVEALRDPKQSQLAQAILRTIPQIDRPAIGPLVMAIRTNDRTLKQYLVRALGQIGYWQSVPYLLALRDAQDTPVEIRSAVDASLVDLQQHGVQIETGMRPADAYLKLARLYYDDTKSLAADARLDAASVWYWREEMVQNVEVPTAIFNEIMAMRCCEEALKLDPSLKGALSLWVAANIRREAELPEGATDHTRPDNYPSAAYFAQAAGAEYCLEALAIANERKEPAVALGAISALRKTAGPASLTLDMSGKQPLAEALGFADRMVRIQAALALGNAIPDKPFPNSQNLMTVLCEAVALQGSTRNALVIDSDENVANSMAGILKGLDYNVISDADLRNGLQKVRNDLPSLDVIIVGSNLAGGLAAGIAELRGELKFAHAPIIVVSKKGDSDAVIAVRHAGSNIGAVAPEATPEIVGSAIRSLNKAAGIVELTPDVATGAAMEAASTLYRLADTSNALFRPTEGEAALIGALKTENPALRERVAQVLGFVGSGPAQEAVAAIALKAEEPEAARIAMFAALADGAKRRGAKLGDATIAALTKVAETDANMNIRTAASQALGALNLPSNPASQIIRNQYAG